jgi:hypothetical protein
MASRTKITDATMGHRAEAVMLNNAEDGGPSDEETIDGARIEPRLQFHD